MVTYTDENVSTAYDGTCSVEQTLSGVNLGDGLAAWLKASGRNGTADAQGNSTVINRVSFPPPDPVITETRIDPYTPPGPVGHSSHHVTLTPASFANASVGKRLWVPFGPGERLVKKDPNGAVDPQGPGPGRLWRQSVIPRGAGLAEHTVITAINPGTREITFSPPAARQILATSTLNISNRYKFQNSITLGGRHDQEWVMNGCEIAAVSVGDPNNPNTDPSDFSGFDYFNVEFHGPDGQHPDYPNGYFRFPGHTFLDGQPLNVWGIQLVSITRIGTTGNQYTCVTLHPHGMTNANGGAQLHFHDVTLDLGPTKANVRLATVAALPTNTWNGIAGPGARLSASANGVLSVDGLAVNNLDRILDKNHATGARRGIYVVIQRGSATTPWILERATDADNNNEVVQGIHTTVTAGTQANTEWALTNIGAFVVDTTAWTWAKLGIYDSPEQDNPATTYDDRWVTAAGTPRHKFISRVNDTTFIYERDLGYPGAPGLGGRVLQRTANGGGSFKWIAFGHGGSGASVPYYVILANPTQDYQDGTFTLGESAGDTTHMTITRSGFAYMAYDCFIPTMRLTSCNRLMLRDGVIGGRSIRDDTVPYTGGSWADEEGLLIERGSEDIEVDNMYVHHVYADGIRIIERNPVGGGQAAEIAGNNKRVWIHHCYLFGMGRQGVTPQTITDHIMEHTYIENVARSCIDSEMNFNDEYQINMWIQYNAWENVANTPGWVISIGGALGVAEPRIMRYNHSVSNNEGPRIATRGVEPPDWFNNPPLPAPQLPACKNRYLWIIGNTGSGESDAGQGVFTLSNCEQVAIVDNYMHVTGAQPAALQTENVRGYWLGVNGNAGEQGAGNDWVDPGPPSRPFHDRTNPVGGNSGAAPWDATWISTLTEPSTGIFSSRLAPGGDGQPPTTPPKPTAISPSVGVLRVSFPQSVDQTPPISYRTFLDGSANPIDVWTPVPQATITRDLPGQTPGSVHTVKVDAFDAVNPPNFSPKSPASDPVTITSPPDTTPPSDPQNVVAASPAPNTVRVDWLGSTDDQATIITYRINRNGVFIATLTAPPGVVPQTWSQSNVPTGDYTYGVDAGDQAPVKNRSALVTDTVHVDDPDPGDVNPPQPDPPPAPSAVSDAPFQIQVTAPAGTDDVVAFITYRFFRDGDLVTPVATVISESTTNVGFIDQGLIAGEQHYYQFDMGDGTNTTAISPGSTMVTVRGGGVGGTVFNANIAFDDPNTPFDGAPDTPPPGRDVTSGAADRLARFVLDQAHAASPNRVNQIRVEQVAINLAAFTANDGGPGDYQTGTVALVGLGLSDLVLLSPPDTNDPGLIVWAHVDAADTLRWKALNRSSSAVLNPANVNYRLLWLEVV